MGTLGPHPFLHLYEDKLYSVFCLVCFVLYVLFCCWCCCSLLFFFVRCTYFRFSFVDFGSLFSCVSGRAQARTSEERWWWFYNSIDIRTNYYHAMNTMNTYTIIQFTWERNKRKLFFYSFFFYFFFFFLSSLCKCLSYTKAWNTSNGL